MRIKDCLSHGCCLRISGVRCPLFSLLETKCRNPVSPGRSSGWMSRETFCKDRRFLGTTLSAPLAINKQDIVGSWHQPYVLLETPCCPTIAGCLSATSAAGLCSSRPSSAPPWPGIFCCKPSFLLSSCPCGPSHNCLRTVEVSLRSSCSCAPGLPGSPSRTCSLSCRPAFLFKQDTVDHMSLDYSIPRVVSDGEPRVSRHLSARAIQCRTGRLWNSSIRSFRSLYLLHWRFIKKDRRSGHTHHRRPKMRVLTCSRPGSLCSGHSRI